MQDNKAGPWCRTCGLLTEYAEPGDVRREYGPSWPFEVGEEEAPGLLSLPIAPVAVCACRAGYSVEGGEAPCAQFAPRL